MRRSPLYAHPSYAPSFRLPQHTFSDPTDYQNAYYLHFPPYPSSPSPSQPPSSRMAPRSVINIPVHDHSSLQAASSNSTINPSHPLLETPPTPSSPPLADLCSIHWNIDHNTAAITIQSHYRGFSVRRHKPLLHLRIIAAAHKQMGTLQADLESPGFALKLRTNEKERLRFNEAVMAIILRLDAIEGSIPEVRSRRKEATRAAIKLQDWVDAFVAQEEHETSSLILGNGTDIDTNRVSDEEGDNHNAETRDDKSYLLNINCSSEEEIRNKPASEDVGFLNKECLSEECGKDEKCSNRVVTDMTQMKEDVTGYIACAPLRSVSICNECLIGGNAGHETGTSGEESSESLLPKDVSAVEGLAPCTRDEGELLKFLVKEGKPYDREEDLDNRGGMDSHDDRVDDVLQTAVATEVATMRVSKEAADEWNCSPAAMQEIDETSIQDDQEYANGEVQEQDMNSKGVCEHTGVEQHSDSPEVQRDVVSDGDVFEASSRQGIQSDDHDESAGLSISERILLQQLSKDCKQLKALLSKLLAQSRAQSKVINVLGDCLEMLEHQQQQQNQVMLMMKGRDRRKPKKGCKK